MPQNGFTRIARASKGLIPRWRARYATWILMRYNADIIRHPQIIAHDKFTIYPEHRIFFDRIAKNANYYVVLTLEEAVRQKPVETGAAQIKQTTKHLTSFSRAEARQLSSYYTFCVSRNPYTRALSGFLDKIGKGKEAKFAKFAGFADNTPQGFTDFLRGLSMDTGGGGQLYRNPHFWPQTEAILFHPSHYKRVVRFECLKEDLELMFQETGLKPIADLVPYGQTHAKDQNKHTGASLQIEKYYTEEGAQLVRAIYRTDFEDFGYSTDLQDAIALPARTVA